METTFPKSVYKIQNKLELILQKDKYVFSLANYKQIRRMLEKSATKHSNEIEHPSLNTTEQKKTFKKIKEEALHNNNKAWIFAKQFVKSGRELDNLFIYQTLKLLEPHQDLSIITGVRKYDIKINGSQFNRPSPTKISGEINLMIHHLKQMNTPLEKAIFSHYHICRIHPGEDGNGRCSRIIQNAYLFEKNYLPIIIRTNERNKYINILEETHRKYYGKEKNYLDGFSEFMVERMKQSIRTYASNIDVNDATIIHVNPKTQLSSRSNNQSKNKTTYHNKKNR